MVVLEVFQAREGGVYEAEDEFGCSLAFFPQSTGPFSLFLQPSILLPSWGLCTLCLEYSLPVFTRPVFFSPPSFRDLFQYLFWDTFPDSHLKHLPRSVTLTVCLCVCLSYWRTLNLQCCVRLRCVAKWFSFAYMYLFFGFFFIIGYVYFCFYSEYF